jgi:hypothetical protein
MMCCIVRAVYTFANISGAHLNPAVTFALMCTGHMKWWKGLLYMVMQVGRHGCWINRCTSTFAVCRLRLKAENQSLWGWWYILTIMDAK